MHVFTSVSLELLSGKSSIGSTDERHGSKYKGSKIDWDVDECAQPLQIPYQTQSVSQPTVRVKKKPASKMENRFATLRLDDEDDDVDSSDEPDLSDSEDASASLSDITAASRY